ncbi:MAG: proteasome accessory factor PafA2 family protein, partial [Verrucomicrobiales bacterium]
MALVFGIETEYGITLEPCDMVDVVAESIALVRCYTQHGSHMKWTYELEDPHRDARGFRVDHLRQDIDEAVYYKADQDRDLSYAEIKSDLVLSNGARFYNDHAHPEYSTPECTTVFEVVAQDKAGERIVAEATLRRQKQIPDETRLLLYKNNTDFHGHSYGCHDNYLINRDLPWQELVDAVLPFFVT